MHVVSQPSQNSLLPPTPYHVLLSTHLYHTSYTFPYVCAPSPGRYPIKPIHRQLAAGSSHETPGPKTRHLWITAKGRFLRTPLVPGVNRFASRDVGGDCAELSHSLSAV